MCFERESRRSRAARAWPFLRRSRAAFISVVKRSSIEPPISVIRDDARAKCLFDRPEPTLMVGQCPLDTNKFGSIQWLAARGAISFPGTSVQFREHFKTEGGMSRRAFLGTSAIRIGLAINKVRDAAHHERADMLVQIRTMQKAIAPRYYERLGRRMRQLRRRSGASGFGGQVSHLHGTFGTAGRQGSGSANAIRLLSVCQVYLGRVYGPGPQPHSPRRYNGSLIVTLTVNPALD